MKNWKDADGTVVSNDHMIDWVKQNCPLYKQDYELIVGVDSHLHGNQYKFVAVVCVYYKGRGGFYYYTTSEQNRREFKGIYPARVKARMFHETSIAIELATEIQEKTGKTPVIHIDASPPNAGEVTSLFSDQLKGYVVASGFEAVLKPWSFVSSGIANKHSK